MFIYIILYYIDIDNQSFDHGNSQWPWILLVPFGQDSSFVQLT